MVCGPLRAGNYAHTNTGETFLHRRLCSGLLFQAGNNSFRLELDSLRHRQLVALLRPTKQFAEKDPSCLLDWLVMQVQLGWELLCGATIHILSFCRTAFKFDKCSASVCPLTRISS